MERPNYATVLPVEIWRECFMLFRAADHKSLARTCRFFHDICLPFIFKSITYCSNVTVMSPTVITETLDLDELKEHIKCFTKIATNPRQRSLVRKCTLVYSLKVSSKASCDDTQAAKNAYDPFVLAFVTSLPSFVNLREVHINFNKRLDKRILDSLALLPNLEQISFTSVMFGVHLLKQRIKLRRLIVNNKEHDTNPNASAKRLDIFSGEHLEHLEILSLNYTPKLFRALTSQGYSLRLTYLSFRLERQDVGVLYPFLATCPNLLSIQWHVKPFYERDVERLTLPPLPLSTIPCLQTFHGFAGAAKAFVPGRPVHKATICSGFWTAGTRLVHVLRDLVLSARPLTDLTLELEESTPENLDLIITSLPQLKRLHVVLPDAKVFTDQDPNIVSLETVSDKGDHPSQDCNPDVHGLQQVEYLSPIGTHAIYMNLLHWIAHQKINLPAGLETLSLHSRYSRYDKLRVGQCGQPYTFSMAHTILATLSIRYPDLQRVEVADSGSKEELSLSWCRSSGGKWSYCAIL